MAEFYRIAELGLSLPAQACLLRAGQVADLAVATDLIAAAEEHARIVGLQAEQNYHRELQRGYEEGLSRARLDAFQRLLAEDSELEIRLQDLGRDLARVVFNCVRKLVDGFADEELAVAMFRSALKQMRRERRAELRVSPSVGQGIKARLGELLRDFPEVELIDVVEDTGLQGSRMILETSIGRVDGDMSIRLRELEEILVRSYILAAAGSSHEGLEAE